jgi:hypothetical protein
MTSSSGAPNAAGKGASSSVAGKGGRSGAAGGRAGVVGGATSFGGGSAGVAGGTTSVGGGLMDDGGIDGGHIPSTSDCYCIGYKDKTFSCDTTLTTAAVHENAGLVCTVPGASTTREPCEDGGFIYRIEEDERRYELRFNANGDLTSYVASGTVSDCGVPSDYESGTIRAGFSPNECLSEWTCVPCGAGDLRACPVCTQDPGDVGRVTLSLEDYCAWSYCPENPTDARAFLIQTCDAPQVAAIEDGCGTVSIARNVGLGLVEYVFDAASLALVGILEEDDVRHGPCRAFTYVAGKVPSEACPSLTRCEFCTPSGNGAAGEGGSTNAPDACLP